MLAACGVTGSLPVAVTRPAGPVLALMSFSLTTSRSMVKVPCTPDSGSFRVVHVATHMVEVLNSITKCKGSEKRHAQWQSILILMLWNLLVLFLRNMKIHSALECESCSSRTCNAESSSGEVPVATLATELPILTQKVPQHNLPPTASRQYGPLATSDHSPPLAR